MKLATFFRGLNEPPTDLLMPEELHMPAEMQPMTKLDHFVSRTKVMVDGLDEQIVDLDAEITRKIHELNDLKRIRAAQALALRFMEGDGAA